MPNEKCLIKLLTNSLHDLSCKGLLLLKQLVLFSEFRNGRSPILVATDVAARGLGQFGEHRGVPGPSRAAGQA